MLQLIVSSAVLSMLHSMLPNHWLSVVAVGKREAWSQKKTVRITFFAGLVHALSTVIIGILISLVGLRLESRIVHFTEWIAPGILVGLGAFFIWQHHRHHHFHPHGFKSKEGASNTRIITFLILAMFFSPCLEFEALYLLAWASGWDAVIMISLIYLFVSVTGMVIWVQWAYKGLERANWHALEHNAGLISGVVLILTGVLFFFFH